MEKVQISSKRDIGFDLLRVVALLLSTPPRMFGVISMLIQPNG